LISSLTGTPPTVVRRVIGTMSSPWPPRTNAVTSFIETLSSLEMKLLKRAVSRMPDMPTIFCLVPPVIFLRA
jgi:hypothetical protein